MANLTLLTIILNYQTAEMTLLSLTAALREMAGIAGEVVVIDNDSQDGSFAKISKAVTDNGWDKNNRARVIQSGRNGGFGAGNNVGIRAGLSNGQKPDFVYILNSDAFPDKGSIGLLLNHLVSHPDHGIAGSFIHGQDQVPHLTAFRFPSIAGEFEAAIRIGPISRILKNSIVPLPIPERACQVDWLAGASMMMRQTMLNQIGLFDEKFFLYFEETDLCRRARRHGWPVYYLRESQVTHIGGVSTGSQKWSRIPQYWLDSRLHYFSKNHGKPYAALATLAHLAGGVLWRLRMTIQGKAAIDPPHFLKDMARHAFVRLAGRQADPASRKLKKLTKETADRR